MRYTRINTFTAGDEAIIEEFSAGPRLLFIWFFLLLLLTIVLWDLPLGIVVCGSMALYALSGDRQYTEMLALLAFLIALNPGSVSLGRWLVLFFAAGKMILDTLRYNKPVPKVVNALLLFSIAVFAMSFMVSPFPMISIFKILSFTLGVSTILTGFYRTRHLTNYWFSWIYTLGVFILVASLPLYGMGLGYRRNGVGFQGILTHPQTFGPVLAPITAIFTGLYLFLREKSYILIGLILLGWIGMFASQSRTAVLAALLGLSCVLILGLFYKSAEFRTSIKRALLTPGFVMLVLAMIIYGGVKWQSIEQRITGFMVKDEGTATIEGAMLQSRGGLATQSMQNFYSAPFTGIGFGIPSDPSQFYFKKGPLGIPISAEVEKGFMPAAVLGETGIVGAVFLSGFLLFLLKPILSGGKPIIAWMCLSSLSINFGEMVFFSMGGMGFYFWIIIGFCYAATIAESDS